MSMRNMSDLISKDSAFASEVLTIANSALYASRVPIQSILQAIALLGTDSLRGVCLTVGVRSYMGKSLNHASLRAIWRHSLACGLIAEKLAGPTLLNKDTAYTAGVLHDIGRTALAVLLPREYAALLTSHAGPSSSLLERERELFGFDHCEAGRQLIASWNLPGYFAEVVSDHHEAALDGASWGIPDLIRLSCRLADTTGFAVSPGCEVLAYPDLLAASTEAQKKALAFDFKSLSTDISTKINALEVAV